MVNRRRITLTMVSRFCYWSLREGRNLESWDNGMFEFWVPSIHHYTIRGFVLRGYPMAGALQDLRVSDFTHALNGPFCTMLLGHLGAEIIKIEPPSGDRFRRSWMPRDAKKDGYEFLWINVNKKSVVLNLKSERGVDLARQLIARADVLVENFQQGTMERFGL